MLEVSDFSTVGRVMSRINDDPDHIIVTLGEHTNDRMTSFYVTTPSGFQIEYGCDGLVVDDDTWQATTTTRSAPGATGTSRPTPEPPPETKGKLCPPPRS
ncbi:hypothetical protein G6048_26840 [Streptomyces sp. YC419]|uniref:Uncharacterized protein n=2 Tax=Streptomyces ureilyticus TaxID=1775131 RepID=A0ABX0DUN7_9ACTN|nr:hypothetical protein [Streptomyces ureilyticus]